MNTYKVASPQLALLPCLFLFLAQALAAPPGGTKEAMPYIASHYGVDAIKWDKGQFINVCRPQDGKCQAVKMPKTLGKVEHVLDGPFISSARASWLAFTKFETYVCAALKMRTTVICARIISEPFPLESVNAAIQITHDNKTRLVLSAKNAGANQSKLADFNASFRKAAWQATYILQGEVDVLAAGTSSFMSSLSICDKDPRYPGPPPSPDCELVDEGGVYMWSCPVIGTPPAPEPGEPTWPDPEPLDPDPCS